jgi:hypothetical protein
VNKIADDETFASLGLPLTSTQAFCAKAWMKKGKNHKINLKLKLCLYSSQQTPQILKKYMENFVEIF